jgi:hypothetical protein
MTDTTVPHPPSGRYLGWRAERRPQPAFAHVLGAVAGAFVVIATVAFIAAIDEDDPQVAGIILSLLLVAVALAAGARGTGPLRSAAVTMLVFAVPLLWLFALVGDGEADRGVIRGVLLLSLASYAVLYLLGWTKGRGVFLGATLALLVIWLAFEVAGDGNDALFGASSDLESFGVDSSDVGDTGETTGAVVMLLGIGYLVTGGLLDRRRLAGAATPFLAVGAVSAIVGGVSLVGQDSPLGAGIVAVLIGAAVGVIGAAGRDRRGTTWLGVLTVFGGLVAILANISPDEPAGVGAIAFGFAVALGALAWWLAPVLQEPDDGLDVTPPDPGASPAGSGGLPGAAPTSAGPAGTELLSAGGPGASAADPDDSPTA